MALSTARMHKVRGRPPLLAAGISSFIHSHSSSVRSLGYVCSFILLFYTTHEDFSDRLLAALMLVGLGFAGGWFIVPLQAFLQSRSRVEERGLLLATTNFLSMGAVLVASGVLWVCHDLLKWQADHIISLAGLGLLLGTIYVLRLLPAF